MKIIHVTSEFFPYAKTGGLADMVGSLAATLADKGHEIAVFVPGYRSILEHTDAKQAKPLLQLENNGGEVRVFSPRKNLTIYLLCNDIFFNRSGIYGIDGHDFNDNHHRYMFFSKGVIETMRLLRLHAHVLHCHDWQTALLPMLLRYTEQRYCVKLAKKTIFTIHNLAFQGKFPVGSFNQSELPEVMSDMKSPDKIDEINMLKNGLLFADQVTTVSPRYAREIQTMAFGCGLNDVVATRANRLIGLINGIDLAVWNPVTDIHLPARYCAKNIGGKHICRSELLNRHLFEPDFSGPVFGMVCRLTEQKGIDLLLKNRDFFSGESKLIILGAGEKHYEDALCQMATTAPDRISFIKGFDESLSHLVAAGSDFFLMPSLFEPCGLNQMYSQTYGTVPLVSNVGGLFDTVTDIDEHPDAGTGLTFLPTASEFRHGLNRAFTLYNEKPRYAAVQQRAMKVDFGWGKAAKAYEQLYMDSNPATASDMPASLYVSPHTSVALPV